MIHYYVVQEYRDGEINTASRLEINGVHGVYTVLSFAIEHSELLNKNTSPDSDISFKVDLHYHTGSIGGRHTKEYDIQEHDRNYIEFITKVRNNFNDNIPIEVYNPDIDDSPTAFTPFVRNGNHNLGFPKSKLFNIALLEEDYEPSFLQLIYEMPLTVFDRTHWAFLYDIKPSEYEGYILVTGLLYTDFFKSIPLKDFIFLFHQGNDFKTHQYYWFKDQLNYPSIFKIKTPEYLDDYNLNIMYDFLFDELCCGWVGKTGHYPYDNDEDRVAKDQDGYIYCWEHSGWSRKISASSTAFEYMGYKKENIPELVLDSNNKYVVK